MREIDTEAVMNDLNDRLGGKGPLKCPVCGCRDFIAVHEPLRVQTAYMSEDAKLVELVFLACEGCFHVLQFHCQDRWFKGYVDPNLVELEAESERRDIERTKKAMAEFIDEQDDEDDDDGLESMLAEIAKPVKAPMRMSKPNKQIRLVDRSHGPDDHDAAQRAEAKRRKSLEEQLDEDIFEEDDE